MRGLHALSYMNYSACHGRDTPRYPRQSPIPAAPTRLSPREVGRMVRLGRAKRGMSRRQLAQESGTSERYLAQIESGAGNPSVLVMRAIADALEIPLFELLPQTGGLAAPYARIIDLLGRVLAGRPAAIAEMIERRIERRGRDRSRPADRAGRSARRGQVDARQAAGGQARRAVHRTQPHGRAGVRRQHAAADRDVRRRHLQAARTRLPRARYLGERSGGDRDGGRHRLQPRDLRAAASPHPHGLGQRAARGTHEPGDEAGRFPADGAQPRGDGRSARDSRSAPRAIMRAPKATLDTSGATVQQSFAKLAKLVAPWMKG